MSLFNPKIYVIDDDQLYMQMLTKSLIHNSYKKVAAFNSATESFNKIESPDIIFIDYHLSDLNGLSASKILKNTWKKSKIVLISSEFSLNKIKNYKKYGIDLMCAKSADFNQVAFRIRQLQIKKIATTILKIGAILLVLSGILILGLSEN